MTTEEEKEISRRAIELWASDTDTDPGQVFASSYVNHQEPSTGGGHEDESLDSYEALIDEYHHAFSDAKVEVSMQVAEGDRVATHWRFTATHTGDYHGVPGTGRRFSWTGIAIDRFEDGKIAETWIDWDKYSFYEGVGLVAEA